MRACLRDGMTSVISFSSARNFDLNCETEALKS